MIGATRASASQVVGKGTEERKAPMSTSAGDLYSGLCIPIMGKASMKISIGNLYSGLDFPIMGTAVMRNTADGDRTIIADEIVSKEKFRCMAIPIIIL